jgi:hypothetical protein
MYCSPEEWLPCQWEGTSFLPTRGQRAGLIYLSLDEFSRETNILAIGSHGGGHLYLVGCQHKIQEWLLLAFCKNILSPSVCTSVLKCSMFLQNTGNYPSDCKVTYPRKNNLYCTIMNSSGPIILPCKSCIINYSQTQRVPLYTGCLVTLWHNLKIRFLAPYQVIML